MNLIRLRVARLLLAGVAMAMLFTAAAVAVALPQHALVAGLLTMAAAGCAFEVGLLTRALKRPGA